MSAALAQQLGPGAAPALDHLHAAREALQAELGSSRPLAERSEQLAAGVCAGLGGSGPGAAAERFLLHELSPEGPRA